MICYKLHQVIYYLYKYFSNIADINISHQTEVKVETARMLYVVSGFSIASLANGKGGRQLAGRPAVAGRVKRVRVSEGGRERCRADTTYQPTSTEWHDRLLRVTGGRGRGRARQRWQLDRDMERGEGGMENVRDVAD